MIVFDSVDDVVATQICEALINFFLTMTISYVNLWQVLILKIIYFKWKCIDQLAGFGQLFY